MRISATLVGQRPAVDQSFRTGLDPSSNFVLYLSNLQRIAPAGAGRQLVTSQVIQLPAARVKRQPKKKKGYGIGGFGGGGGVF